MCVCVAGRLAGVGGGGEVEGDRGSRGREILTTSRLDSQT